ncbi:hypothetical protein MML48_1g09239 [Holotrichia oblita]|uniref:Uncharacterized protein n=1 Tax=Holotrichia oblita TaxID=644536 RepID=A0ACB9TVN2_HOLOL|nr:hypothetical protein MML48_1g09239 [Holotrichia oblita]
MDQTPEIKKSTIYLTEVETLAQQILTDKESKLRLSNAQNKFREAYRALQQNFDKKSWMKLGSVYIEIPTEECKNIMKNGKTSSHYFSSNYVFTELDKITLDIDNLHETIRDKVHKLRDLEHQPGIEGFRLKPMTAAEVKAINKGFGLS